MIKNMYKFIFIICLTLYGSISNTFADLNLSRPSGQIYEVTEDGLDGLKFSSRIEATEIPDGFFKKFESNNGYCLILGDLALTSYGTAGAIQHTRANNRFYSKDKGDIIFKICGANWLTYGNEQAIYDYEKNSGCVSGDCSMFANIKKYYPTRGEFNGSYKFEVKKCIKNIHDCDGVVALGRCNQGSNSNSCSPVDGGINFTINDRVYRENMYNGEEVINYNCKDPRPEVKEYDIFRNKEQTYQTYYMRGYDAGNYACERYLEKKVTTGDEFDQAYKCCLEAQQSVCIYQYEKNNMATFCSIYDDTCKSSNTGNVEFKVFKNSSITDGVEASKRYCIKTYNLCPYNFNVEFGSDDKSVVFERIATEESMTKCQNSDDYANCDIKYEKDDCTDANGESYPFCEGKNKNFLQYNRHCTIVDGGNIVEFTYTNTYSPYIDKSCINLIGNSHNTTNYASYSGYDRVIDKYPKTMFTPGVECFVETMKNLLMNRAGHTRCKLPTENPNYKDICPSGEEFKAGQEFETDIEASDGANVYKHPLQDLIRYTKNIVYVFAAFSISLYGYNVLIKGGALGSRTEITMLIIKIAFIIALTTNTSWYNLIFKFTYGVSDVLFSAVSKIGFDTVIDTQGNLIRDDGCYFGDINSLRLDDDSPEVAEAISRYDNNYSDYPSDRIYLSFFDSLDCKIAKYFGYSIVQDGFGWGILKLYVLAFTWPFGVGLFIGFITMFTGITLFVFALKVAYIYVASMVALTILLFLSPIVIPTILFKKFSGIFQKWLKNVIGYAIQPCIMTAFISVSIMIIDNFMLGEAFFTGTAPNKELVCGFSCYDQNTGTLLSYTSKRPVAAQKMMDEGMSALSESGASEEEKKIEEQKLWINVFNTLTSEGVDMGSCSAGDKIVDIKRNSPLCIMHNIGIGLIFGIIPYAADVDFKDVISFLRILVIVFILDNVLNKIPRMASTLTGSAATPGLGADTNPFALVGKAVEVASFLKRLAVGFVKGKINKSKMSKLKAKVEEKNKKE